MSKIKNNNPLVSIITITYNSEKYLQKTINSVESQNYKNIEYIVIDGESTDNTLGIIKNNEDKIDIWISEKDNGIADAFNKGVKLSNGDIIGIINSDDYYSPDAVNNVVDCYFEKGLEGKDAVIYGKTKKLRLNGEITHKRHINEKWHIAVPFSHCSSFATKWFYEKNGYFKTCFKIGMDTDLLLRGAKNGSQFIKIDKFLACQREGGASYKNALRGYREYFHCSKGVFPLHKRLCGVIYKYIVFILARLKNKLV